MISYMHVISKNHNCVIAEVEMIWLEESQKKDYITSAVFSVIHNDGQIVRVIEKDIEATKKMAALKKKVVVA